jgi:hypothetical protein
MTTDDTLVRYRSAGGLAIFGGWVAFLLTVAIYYAWIAATHRDSTFEWFVEVAIAGFLLHGMYVMSLQLTITRDGRLVFRSLLRRREWNLNELLTIRRGTGYSTFGCMIFDFWSGSTALATVSSRSWKALVDRIRELNPGVKVIE